MRHQVFLGGACGMTTWRRDIAIPLLDAAQITYYDPQLGLGEWTEAQEAAEMRAKAEADVLLFVISGQTRGVAAVGEVSYLLAAQRPLALALEFIPENALFEGRIITPLERDDLNRGRIFVRTMAAQHGVPVFDDVAEATQYAVQLIRRAQNRLTLEMVRSILEEIHYKHHQFNVEETLNGFHLYTQCIDEDNDHPGETRLMFGRKWFIDKDANRSAVVRTALKAVLTWEEHEAREHFTYRGAQVFDPHLDADRLVEVWENSRHVE